MCGIAGYLGTRQLGPETLNGCLDVMRRRGPDSAGVSEHEQSVVHHLYLLGSRLNVIDLDDRANHPIRDGSTTMVFNGELYNYRELRSELSAKGHLFRTNSDTEVMLKTLQEFGWSGLDKCEGMWAFALFDDQDGTLTLCRDRFGEKPLYYYRDHSGLYFGSEVKFIATLLGRKLEVNYDHLYRYMVNGYKALY